MTLPAILYVCLEKQLPVAIRQLWITCPTATSEHCHSFFDASCVAVVELGPPNQAVLGLLPPSALIAPNISSVRALPPARTFPSPARARRTALLAQPVSPAGLTLPRPAGRAVLLGDPSRQGLN